jgi:glycolate oxidase
VAVAADKAESEALLAARRMALPAMERLGLVLTEDVCVPVSRIPAVL